MPAFPRHAGVLIKMLIARCLQNTQVLKTWAFEKHRYAMLCELQVFFRDGHLGRIFPEN